MKLSYKALITTVALFMALSLVVQASGESQHFLNGLQTLYYYSARIDERLPSLDPVQAGIREFEQSIREGESVAESRLMLGMLYQAVGKVDEALKQYQGLEEELDGQDHGWVYVLMGDVYQRMGYLGLALESYDKALAEQPYARGYYGRGRALSNQGDYVGATEAFIKALDESEGFLAARLELGKSQYYAGEHENALETLELANRQNPNLAPVNYYLGLLYREAGKEEQAQHSFERAVQLDPDYQLAKEQLNL